MRHTVHAGRRRAYSLIAAGGLVVGGFMAATAPPKRCPPPTGSRATPREAPTTRSTRSKIANKKAAQKQAALQKRLEGDKAMQGKVAKVGKGQYVKLENEGTDKIFVVIAEFGDQQYPNPIFQGPPPDGSTTDVTGPRRNEIPQPDRAVDNSHPVAGRLQQGPLRGHVLQPDEGLLRDAVLGSLLRRR